MKALAIFFTFFIYSCSNNDKQSNFIFPDGGYDFPKSINPNDSNFFSYPLKNVMPRRDSFRVANESPYFLKSFQEPNLSLRPSKEPTFRLIYMDRFDFIIATITRNNATIKKWVKGQVFPIEDEGKLTELEKQHYYTLQRSFPLDEIKPNVIRQRIADSMLMLYPQLRSANYYQSLVNKISTQSEDKVLYSTEIIYISNATFERLVNLINSSGYWKLPYNTKCHDVPMDAGGFFLEANSGFKYNIVTGSMCGDKPSDFIKACEELIKVIRLDDKINLSWN